MDRREFLRLMGLGLAAAGLAGCQANAPTPAPAGVKEGQAAAPATKPAAPAKDPQPAPPQPEAKKEAPPPDLVVAEGTDPASLIDKGLAALGGIGRFVKKGHLVVIKPNFSVPRKPDEAATTNPWLLVALIKQCQQAGAREIRVIDNPFTNAEMCLENSRIRKECSAAGAKVFVIQKEANFTPVAVKGTSIKEVRFSKDALEADVFINFPILKHHGQAKLTMGLKGMMGLIQNRGAFHAAGLHRPIAELATVKKPHLIILDAIRGITDRGPMGPGTIREYKQVVFGTDPLAVDAYGAELFGAKLTDIEHLKIAAELGIGQADWKKISLKRV